MFNKLSSTAKGLIILNCAISVVIFGVLSLFFSYRHEKAVIQKKTEVVAVQKKSEEKKLPSDEDHAEIESMIQQTLGEDADRFAVYIFRPGRDLTPIMFQNRPMRPASMIKMFVLAKAMQDIKEGKYSLDDELTVTPENVVGGAGSIAGLGYYAKVPVRLLLEHMIKESDNTATNILIDKVGGLESLNEYLRQKNYSDTNFQHKMMLAYRGLTNLSSVKDLGDLFVKIYNHQCVDDFHDKLMIEYLLKQEDTDCLPTALLFWKIAHKTGEVDMAYHDGGICYGEKADFIIVMMNDNYTDRYSTLEKMQTIAKNVANKIERERWR